MDNDTGEHEMIQTKDYLEGLLLEDNIFVRAFDDKPSSEYYTYWFRPTTESAKKPKRIRILFAKYNTKDSGFGEEYAYLLTIADTDGSNVRKVAATKLLYDHYRYNADGTFDVVSLEEWQKHGRIHTSCAGCDCEECHCAG